MNEEQRKKAEAIMGVLQGQRFADWYLTGNMDLYIHEGPSEQYGVPKETVLRDIVRIFNIK